MSDNRLERMRELTAFLNKAAHAYYVMDDPIISDMKKVQQKTGVQTALPYRLKFNL